MLSSDDQRLCITFGEGRVANDRGEVLQDNPHPPDTLEYDAWAAGWVEQEGPDYTITPRATRDYGKRATLADIWPKS